MSNQRSVDAVADQVVTLLGLSEDLLCTTVRSGARTVDSEMVETAQSLAARIGVRFDDAMRNGEITSSQLFDDVYVAIPDTDPQQYLTAFTMFTDRVLTDIQDKVLEGDARVVFCAAVDRNGYLPTHNLPFSHRQGADATWNASHCRNRRIFNDRVGLRAGRNREPFLLQAYRRDMGKTHVLMKEVSVPIMIDGRHWGGLRLAYKAETDLI